MCDIPTNCPNCSAPINTLHNKCEYCDTPYPWKAEEVFNFDPIFVKLNEDAMATAIKLINIWTPNEMRRHHGLRDI